MDKKKYDVIIVGAGPAGSTAAKLIADEGFKVLLVDKAKFPRDKPCGGALTRRIVERFPHISENLQNLVGSEIFGGKIYSPSLKYTAKMESDKPLGYMVFRKEFDFELVKLAKESGVEFWDNYQVFDVIFSKNNVTLKSLNGNEVYSKVVIGADGVRSIIAKKSGLNPRWKLDQIGVCILKEFHVEEPLADRLKKIKQSVHIHVGFENIYGYAWMFHKKSAINIGLGCLLSEKKNNLKELFYQYVDLLKNQNFIPNLDIEDLKGGLIPLKLPLKKTYGDKVILIGDAAGFVNSLSGEGLYYAICSGELAARTCIELLIKAKDFSKKNLSHYQKLWIKDFGKELKGILFLRRFTRIWLEGIIKYASLDKKWRKMIMNVILGQKKVSKISLAWRYFWCRGKFWIIDMFYSVINAIAFGFSLFYVWWLHRLNQLYDGFEKLVIYIATFGQNKLELGPLNKKDIKNWEDIFEIMKNPYSIKKSNLMKYLYSKFQLLLNSFVKKIRLAINSF